MKTAEEILKRNIKNVALLDSLTQWHYSFILKAMEEYRSQSQWVSVDNPPEPYRKVILCFQKETEGMKAVIKTGFFTGNSWNADGGFPLLTNIVTHWQPLPTSPKQ